MRRGRLGWQWRARAELGIPRGERILGWGTAGQADGQQSIVAATDRALYAGEVGGRLPWDQVVKAHWDDPSLDLVTSGSSGSIRLHLLAPGGLPDAVHTAVTDSVIVTERLELGSGEGAQAVARRGSDDGQVHWSVAFDAGLDPSDPDVRARADRALQELRSTLGI